MKFSSLATSLAILAADVFALFDGEQIVQLTSDNFTEKVEDDKDNAWVVTFYADWCPYCKTFSSEFDLASKDTKLKDKKILFGAVDVMANRDLTSKFGIKRSPTVKLFGKDKADPEDYLGHRKQADLVDHCADYCKTNEFVKPKEEEPKEAEYEYYIDPIIKQIAGQHDSRIIAAQSEQKTAIQGLSEEWKTELGTLNESFEKKYNELKEERNKTIKVAYDSQKEKVADLKTANAAKIAELDNEAIQAVTQIVNSYTAGDELANTIPALGYDWIDIKWDNTNRVSKKQLQAARLAPQNGYQPQYQNNGYQVAGPAQATPAAGYAQGAAGAGYNQGAYGNAGYGAAAGGYGYGNQQAGGYYY